MERMRRLVAFLLVFLPLIPAITISAFCAERPDKLIPLRIGFAFFVAKSLIVEEVHFMGDLNRNEMKNMITGRGDA